MPIPPQSYPYPLFPSTMSFLAPESIKLIEDYVPTLRKLLPVLTSGTPDVVFHAISMALEEGALPPFQSYAYFISLLHSMVTNAKGARKNTI